MAKKRKKSFMAKYGKYLLLVFALAVIGMAFLPAIVGDDSDSGYTGWEVSFGKELLDISGIGTNSVIEFSILATLGFLMPVIICVLVIVLMKNRQLAGLICFIAFGASAVLCFILPSITNISLTLPFVGTTTKTFADMGCNLGIGAILAGVFSSLGAVTSLGYAVMK